jgi:hypothetical protein
LNKLNKYYNYRDNKCKLVCQGVYYNSQRALELLDENGSVQTRITVCVDEDLKDNEIAIKDYTENEGMWKWLVDNDLVEDVYYEIPAGYTTIKVARLNDELYKDLCEVKNNE